jgi:hypothetical protein
MLLLRRLILLTLQAVTVRSHSWLDCVDYDCPGAAPDAGPQPPTACTCKGYPRNWANVMAGVPFAGDRGRDNRPGAAANAGGLKCDAGKEPDPGPGATIPAGMYSDQYPAATLAKGQTVRWRWPAKNHANTPAAGTVEVYFSNTPNTGDTFTTTTPIAGQMSYSSDGGDCLGLGTSTDTADCQGTWTVPTTLQEGRYTVLWFWEFNAGEYYNSCADVMITAATPGSDGGGTGGGGAVGSPPPPSGGAGGSTGGTSGRSPPPPLVGGGSSQTSGGGSRPTTSVLLVLIAIVLIAGLGGWCYLKSHKADDGLATSSVEVKTATETPAPPAPSGGAAGALPHDWQEMHDPNTGRRYYHNRRTTVTTWVRPAA